eukprot:gene18029-23670_t
MLFKIQSYKVISYNNLSKYKKNLFILHQNDISTDGRKTLGTADIKKKSSEKIDVNPPKGTRDFYPEDHRLKTWLFNSWRSVASLYGFEEYDAPVVENEALFIRKAGDEVTQQLYNFVDKGDRRLSLRPEMTPSLARMVLGKGGALSYPIKWFSIPQCWRYERMTRGRRREHYQWNMDIWGVEGIEAEAELLSAIVYNFKSLGLTSEDIGIKVNSRKLLNDMMLQLGIPKDKWAATCVLVDKLEKIPLNELENELTTIGLLKSTVETLLGYIQAPNLNELKTLLGEKAEGIIDIENLFELANSYGYKDWLVFDASVVRGLSYYTGIVFEGFDKSKQLRAVCGGGRYDNLLESLGGDSTPAVGFGFGDAVIVELLKMKNLIPDFSKNDIDVMVFSMDSSLKSVAVNIASKLRNKGIKTDLILQDKKTKWVFQRADKIGVDYVVLVAPDEYKENKVVVKKLSNSSQSSYNIEELSDFLHNEINSK